MADVDNAETKEEVHPKGSAKNPFKLLESTELTQYGGKDVIETVINQVLDGQETHASFKGVTYKILPVAGVEVVERTDPNISDKHIQNRINEIEWNRRRLSIDRQKETEAKLKTG